MESTGRAVWLSNKKGKVFVCTLESKCNDFVCKLDDRKTPKKYEELSKRERSNCWDATEVTGI